MEYRIPTAYLEVGHTQRWRCLARIVGAAALEQGLALVSLEQSSSRRPELPDDIVKFACRVVVAAPGCSAEGHARACEKGAAVRS